MDAAKTPPSQTVDPLIYNGTSTPTQAAGVQQRISATQADVKDITLLVAQANQSLQSGADALDDARKTLSDLSQQAPVQQSNESNDDFAKRQKKFNDDNPNFASQLAAATQRVNSLEQQQQELTGNLTTYAATIKTDNQNLQSLSNNDLPQATRADDNQREQTRKAADDAQQAAQTARDQAARAIDYAKNYSATAGKRTDLHDVTGEPTGSVGSTPQTGSEASKRAPVKPE